LVNNIDLIAVINLKSYYINSTFISQTGDFWVTSEQNKLKLQNKLSPSIHCKSNVICLKPCSQSCSRWVKYVLFLQYMC